MNGRQPPELIPDSCGMCEHYDRATGLDKYRGRCRFYDEIVYSSFPCLGAEPDDLGPEGALPFHSMVAPDPEMIHLADLHDTARTKQFIRPQLFFAALAFQGLMLIFGLMRVLDQPDNNYYDNNDYMAIVQAADDAVRNSEGWLLLLGLIYLVGGVVFAVGIHEYRIQPKRVQEAREELSSLIADQISSGKGIYPFALYCRPFDITGKLRFRNPAHRSFGFRMKGKFEPKQLDIETALADALIDDSVLLGLGTPGSSFGSGHLPTQEEDWENTVQSLMEEAEIIIIIPSAHRGTFWEVEQVLDRKDFLQKSLFVMPPRAANNRIEVAEIWERARKALGKRLSLPEFHPEGKILKYGEGKELEAELPLLDLLKDRTIFLSKVRQLLGRPKS